MRSIWQSLAWKEWHEHKWKLTAIATILIAVTIMVIWVDAPTAFVSVLVLLSYGVVPLAVFLGASDAAGDATRGTLHFTQALPVSMRRVAIAKFVFGLTSCIFPILLSIGLVCAWYLAQGRFSTDVNNGFRAALRSLWRPAGIDDDITVWILGATTVAASIAVSVYIWTLAVGVNQRTEVRAGGIALLVGTLLWVCFITAGALFLRGIPPSSTLLLAVISSSILPGGFPVSLAFALWGPTGEPSYAVLAAVISALFYPFLVLAFVLRFGSPEAIAVRSREPFDHLGQSALSLPPPCRTALAAVVWKQCRESGPLVIMGLLVVFAFFAGNYLLDPGWYAPSARLAELLTSITIPVGFLLALVVGISNFDQDMSPKINEFWRSRPIQVDLWFWAKYLAGMVILLAALYAPIAIAYSFVDFGLESRHATMSGSGTAMMMFCFHLAAYATGSAALILIRQPVYGAILCIGVISVGFVSTRYLSRADGQQLEWIIYAVELLTAILATLVAWLAIRNDWGAKSRY